MKEFTAGPNEDGVRLSRFVLRLTQGLTGGTLHRAFRNRRIKVNGRRAAPEDRLRPGDHIELYLNDELFPQTAKRTVPCDGPLPPLTVVWEDETLAVLYKPAGLLSHGDDHGRPGLAEAFVRHLVAKGEFDPSKEAAFTPALCNRLDRNTEGLVLGAKRQAALRGAGALLKEGLIHKIYLCIAAGQPSEGTHHAFLQRDRARHTAFVTQDPGGEAKPIATGVRVLGAKGGLSLCEVTLFTGRTHQIRAHMAALGAPLLGDKKYGGPPLPGKGQGVPAQALCAWKLAFADALPPENPLAALAGRRFTAPHPQVEALWESL